MATNIPRTRRPRPVRDAISAVSNTIGTSARVFSTAASIVDSQLNEFQADMQLDAFEAETERLVRRAELEAERAQLLSVPA